MRASRLVAALSLLCSSAALAYSTGAGSCDYPNPILMSPSQPGTDNFQVTTSQPSYAGGDELTVTLSGPVAFKGFLIQAVAGNPGTPNVNTVGTFHNVPPNAQLKSCGGNASGAVTHVNNTLKSVITLQWTAPPAGTGTVTFQAVAVVSLSEWYGQTTLISVTLPEVPGDGGTTDAGTFDSGTADAGIDGGGADAGVDAGSDAGADAGDVDGGGNDSGTSDAGETDSGVADSGSPDSGAPDAGSPDAGTPDAGCPSGAQLCGAVCVNVAIDSNNCGQCGKACSSTEQCNASTCVCVTGLSRCGESCLDLRSDPANCGSCGRACASGQVCSQGNCASSCAAGLSDCSGACIDTRTDPNHCGTCVTVCAGGSDHNACSDGLCVAGPVKPCGCGATEAVSGFVAGLLGLSVVRFFRRRRRVPSPSGRGTG